MAEEEKKVDPEIVLEEGTLETEADSVRISTEVIGIVAGIAASEVTGIFGMSSGLVGGITEKLGRKDLSKGIKVHQEGEKVKLDINIIVEYGVRIPEVAQTLKRAVRQAVEETTGLKVTSINIHVQGIHLGREEQKEEGKPPAEQ